MLRWLERKLGPYPFDRAGAVVVPSDSAMETQTLVTMGSELGYDDSLFRRDLLHEYAHQWYGDAVTPDDWKDLWLNESFAMYVQIRWEIAHKVRSAKEWRRTLDDLDEYFRKTGGPPGSYKPSEFGSGSVYYSGARMLWRLRERLGAPTFDRLLRSWPQRTSSATAVSTAGTGRFAERQTGADLHDFIDRWLDAKRSPR